jgi:glycosyltransferase involved in cell wall biosynthesis
MAEHLALHGFANDRIHVNPLYAPIADDLNDSPAPLRVPNLIGFAGQLVRGKGVDVLLQAMTRLQENIRLEIAGAGRQEDELKKRSDSLGLGSRVKFLGRLGANRLAAFYQRAAIVAMPSRAPETFGLAGLEANSHGTPVIATNVGGISTWLDHGVNGLLVPPNNAEQLAVALSELLDHPEKRMEMGRVGRDICRRKFSPQQHRDRLIATFENSLRSAAK